MGQLIIDQRPAVCHPLSTSATASRCQQWLWRNNTALETCLEDLYLCPLSPISSTQRLSLTKGIVIEIQRNLGRRHPPPFMPSGYDLQWRDFDLRGKGERSKGRRGLEQEKRARERGISAADGRGWSWGGYRKKSSGFGLEGGYQKGRFQGGGTRHTHRHTDIYIYI